MFLRNRRLGAEHSRLIPGSPSHNAIRLHKILLHLMVYHVRLGQLLVFKCGRVLLRVFLHSAHQLFFKSILVVQAVWIILLLRYFYEEVVLMIVPSAALSWRADSIDYHTNVAVDVVQIAATFDVSIIVSFHGDEVLPVLIQGSSRVL